tara:strand:+ start:139 stop:690 length:552 start_codon:yes stop_codon:yes gene_type:complete
MFVSQLKYFQKITLSRFIESQIQECAFRHLGVPDMGKLRDRFEGQKYYNSLRSKILSEFAFEKLLGLGDFDWEKRKERSSQESTYIFNNKKISLITFSKGNLPLFRPEYLDSTVFIYTRSDLNVYISGLATKKEIVKHCITPLNHNPMNRDYMELAVFKSFPTFKSKLQLLSLLEEIETTDKI